jgi:hypothetical protein
MPPKPARCPGPDGPVRARALHPGCCGACPVLQVQSSSGLWTVWAGRSPPRLSLLLRAVSGFGLSKHLWATRQRCPRRCGRAGGGHCVGVHAAQAGRPPLVHAAVRCGTVHGPRAPTPHAAAPPSRSLLGPQLAAASTTWAVTLDRHSVDSKSELFDGLPPVAVGATLDHDSAGANGHELGKAPSAGIAASHPHAKGFSRHSVEDPRVFSSRLFNDLYSVQGLCGLSEYGMVQLDGKFSQKPFHVDIGKRGPYAE